jgi:hypothetical protein
MTMNPLKRPSTFSTAGVASWMLHLAARMLARALNMPEPLLRTTGVLMFAQVQAVETKAAKRLCPVRLLRQFQSWLRPPRAEPFPSPHRKGELP